MQAIRKCLQCAKKKPVEAFNYRNRLKDIRQTYCAECGSKYTKRHYQQNKEYYGLKARRNEAIAKRVARTFVLSYLSQHPCVDCDEADPIVLHFDHVRGKKKYDISAMVGRGMGANSIQLEIQKCEVRCASCHLRKTAKERNFNGFMSL